MACFPQRKNATTKEKKSSPEHFFLTHLTIRALVGPRAPAKKVAEKSPQNVHACTPIPPHKSPKKVIWPRMCVLVRRECLSSGMVCVCVISGCLQFHGMGESPPKKTFRVGGKNGIPSISILRDPSYSILSVSIQKVMKTSISIQWSLLFPYCFGANPSISIQTK